MTTTRKDKQTRLWTMNVVKRRSRCLPPWCSFLLLYCCSVQVTLQTVGSTCCRLHRSPLSETSQELQLRLCSLKGQRKPQQQLSEFTLFPQQPSVFVFFIIQFMHSSVCLFFSCSPASSVVTVLSTVLSCVDSASSDDEDMGDWESL